MGAVISSGVGSGLDIQGLVQRLVDAEGAPKALRLDQEEAKVQSKLSALGTLQSALASFRDTLTTLKSIDRYQGRQATLSPPEFLSATATAAAVPGVYSIEVQQLASAHKLQSGDYASSSAVVGTGTLQIQTGGGTLLVEIDSASNTLAGIAAAINEAAVGNSVVATVVSGTAGARLTIAARDTGASSALTITVSGGDGGLAGLVYPPSGTGLTQVSAAADARVLIDGVLATSSTNTLSGAITGVDLTVKAANEAGETSQLAVDYNRTAARRSVDDFVKSYNAVVDALKSVTSFNVETRQSAPLFGDGGVRNIVDQLRRVLSSSVSQATGGFDTLAKIGITAQLDGKLTVDSADLDATFSVDFDSIGQLFAAEDTGLAIKLDELLEPYLATQGVFDSRTAALKSTIELISDRREALSVRLESLQARYTKQFNALDGLLAQLQSTSNFLNQQLSQLPGSAPLRSNRG